MPTLLKRLIFLLLVSICLNVAITGIAQTEYRDTRTEKTATESPSRSTLPLSNASTPQGEPLLLLLFGLAVFVGATTVKKRKSGLR